LIKLPQLHLLDEFEVRCGLQETALNLLHCPNGANVIPALNCFDLLDDVCRITFAIFGEAT
jgi:hypothetical protein